MKKLPPPPFDPEAMERRSASFRSTVTIQLERLSEHSLYDFRPRHRLLTAAAADVALGRGADARVLLSTLARLAVLSLTAGAEATAVSTALRWPPSIPRLETRGPADAVGASDWVLAFAAALVADDQEAEAALAERRALTRDAAGVRIDPYWGPLADSWCRLTAGDVRAAGASLARALELADPRKTIMSADYVLAIIAPTVEVTLRALERDQPGFTASIEKGVERLAEVSRTFDELALLPIHLLGAVRLGLRRGLAIELDAVQLGVLTKQ